VTPTPSSASTTCSPGAAHKLAERYGPPDEVGYDVHFHVYGRDGVLGEYEPTAVVAGHEVGIVVEATAGSPEARGERLCTLASRNLFYARLPEVKGTAGGASFFSDEVLAARARLRVDPQPHDVARPADGTHPERALGLFRTQLITVDGKGP
jgi:hypothetical protein